MAREAREHVYGPYRRGQRWRVVLKCGDVQQAWSFPSEGEAREEIARLKKQISGRTVSDALDLYLDHLAAKGDTKSTIATLRRSIGRLATGGLMVADVGIAKARALYAAIVPDYAADTHQNSLRDTRAMWTWLGKTGVASSNPWAHVEVVGKRKKGKPQLRMDEARRLVDLCLARQDEPGAVATLLAFMLAMRIGEIVALVGRDIDDDGRLVWIERGKTKNARRALEVPVILRPALVRMAAEAGQIGRLFPFTSNWVTYWTITLAAGAGVQRVTGHGLRGTHTTLATDAGATAHVVAAQLGHGGPAVTREHYIAPGAEDRAIAGKLAGLVNGNVSSRYPTA
jgi:integrase